MAPQSVPHLLSIQGSVVQAGHAALEAEFRHPIVDQQEVPQLEEKGTKDSAIRGPPPRRSPGPRATAHVASPLDPWLSGAPPRRRGCELNGRSRSHF